eukprot:COSAG02_NODE_173_length_31245_cov_413.548096_11_plen_264_part_00
MLSAFVTIGLLYVGLSLIPESVGSFMWIVLGISAGGVLFVIECLDFWRYGGTLRTANRDHSSPRTCLLIRLLDSLCAQDLWQPSRVHLLRENGRQDSMPGQVPAELLLSRAPVRRWRGGTLRRHILCSRGNHLSACEYGALDRRPCVCNRCSPLDGRQVGFGGILFTATMYLVAWRREEATLGTGDYEGIVDSGAKAGAGYATAGAQYAAQDPRVKAYAYEQAKNHAKQQANEALLGSDGMRVGEANYGNMESGDVAYSATEI